MQMIGNDPNENLMQLFNNMKIVGDTKDKITKILQPCNSCGKDIAWGREFMCINKFIDLCARSVIHNMCLDCYNSDKKRLLSPVCFCCATNKCFDTPVTPKSPHSEHDYINPNSPMKSIIAVSTCSEECRLALWERNHHISMPSFKDTCANCKLKDKNNKLCGGCREIGYCSIQCQTKDWKNHRPTCKLSPLPDIKKIISILGDCSLSKQNTLFDLLFRIKFYLKIGNIVILESRFGHLNTSTNNLKIDKLKEEFESGNLSIVLVDKNDKETAYSKSEEFISKLEKEARKIVKSYD